MAGYYGKSMSNSAIKAYNEGKKPWSKWSSKKELTDLIEAAYAKGNYNFDCKKLLKLPLPALKDMVLVETEWHHTSYKYNRTPFLQFSPKSLANITNEKIDAEKVAYDKFKEKSQKVEWWHCQYKAQLKEESLTYSYLVTGDGYIKGQWFYIENPNTHKVEKHMVLCQDLAQIKMRTS